jgi:methylamine---glutamate N-methyltransferase subunit C
MMIEFWMMFAAISLGLTGVILVAFLLYHFKMRKRVSAYFHSKAILEWYHLIKKISWRDYFETNLRAETGNTLERPFGTPLHYVAWDRVLFNPVYLSRIPLGLNEPVETEVILGLQAKKPLHLKIPIIIAGMSYGGALSLQTKIALAKASTMAGTATNSGSGPFVAEERAAAAKYILQYSKGFWSKSETVLRQTDLIEVSLGHGAWGSAPVRIKGSKVTNGFARRLDTIAGLDVIIEASLPEVDNQADWVTLIRSLKEITAGVPVAVKMGGTHNLEKELPLILEGDVDVIVIDGAEGGSHSVPPILSDDTGLPTLPALCRSARFLREHQLDGKISLVVGGGLYTPGDFLKCLALGADAVVIGTVAALAVSHTQVLKSVPWEPPTGLIYYEGKAAQKFNPDLGAKHLNHYLQSCVSEMKQAARTMGKRSLKEINQSDLVTLDSIYAEMAGIDWITP